MPCPKCGKELTTYYCCAGGMIFIGCSDILCGYKEEVKNEQLV
jgi:ssDNA-binding Zn-finger/Zn-ribbon topoisomerase 1